MNLHLLLIAALALLLTAAFGATARAQEQSGGVQLTAGTFQVGGYVGARPWLYVPSGGQSNAGIALSAIPRGGYFVLDSVEVLARIHYSNHIDHSESMLQLFGLDLGGRYIFDWGTPLHPYAGVQGGLGYSIEDEEYTGTDDKTATSFWVSAPIGLLLALNRNVAVSFEAEVKFSKVIGEDNRPGTINIPVGYLGVEAFF